MLDTKLRGHAGRKTPEKCYDEIRARIGLTKAQIYRYLGWKDPAFKPGGSPEKQVKFRSSSLVPHPWDKFLYRGRP